MKTKMTAKKEYALRAEQVRIQTQLNAIDFDRRQAKAEKLVGQCYRYRNSYGCAHDGKWWLYVKIVSAENGCCKAMKFEHTSNGTFTLSFDNFFSASEGYEHIAVDDFDAALFVFMDDIKKEAAK